MTDTQTKNMWRGVKQPLPPTERKQRPQTHTTNAELVEIALKIAAMCKDSNVLRAKAYPLPSRSSDRRELLKQAIYLDDRVFQLCDELRRACLKAHKIEVPAQPGERIVPLAAAPEWQPMG